MNIAGTIQGVTPQELADMLPTGIVILSHQDEPVFVNQRFRELTTCQSGKSFKCWSKSIHPEDYDQVAHAYFEALRDKNALRIEYRTRGQTSLWRALVLAPLDDADTRRLGLGSQGGFICTITDITLEKTAELLQRRIAGEAEERKQQQERFIDMISHEVRNPLSAIVHCTEDIVQAVQNYGGSQAPSADIMQAAETISLCVAHQKKIVDDVLIFSKLDASMVTLSLRSIQPKRDFGNSLTIFRPELRKQNIRLEYKLDHSYAENNIEWVMADIDRMSQVLINLVSNAIKFTAKCDGTRAIRVSLGASSRRPPSYPPNVVFFDSGEDALRLDATNTPEWGEGKVIYIMAAVKDTGIGISECAQKRLFARFNQATPRTQNVYGGSGLGLNVSRKLCHLHGGEIGVSAKEGEGSTFGFFFKVRRALEPFSKAAPSYNKFEVEKLCAGVQAISTQALTPIQRTITPENLENPPVTRVEEVAPGAPSDERFEHTAQIARKACQVEPSATEEECQRPASRSAALPREQGRLSKSDSAHEQLWTSTTGSRKILVVEDNVINRQVISRKLETLGFHVLEATNGKDAMDAVKHNHFDCILMDQEMPEMDGISATMAIRKLEENSVAHIPILGVTANVRAAQQIEMLNAGMDDIIHKPYRTNALFEKISQLMILQGKEGND